MPKSETAKRPAWSFGPVSTGKKLRGQPEPAAQSLEDRLKLLITGITGYDDAEIGPFTRLVAQVDMDSLDFVELFERISEEFSVDVPDDYDWSALVTFDDLLRLCISQDFRQPGDDETGGGDQRPPPTRSEREGSHGSHLSQNQ